MKMLRKLRVNDSLWWKYMIEAFPMIRDWLAWEVGNGKNIRLGEDTWVNLGLGFNLFEELVSDLHDRGIYSIWDARARDFNYIG
jgi:hypothetical protein